MKSASIALTALVLLSLTACAGTPETAPSEPVVSGQSVTEETVEETPEPLVAAETETTPDEMFIGEVKWRLESLGAASVIPDATDEQLIQAGHDACESLEAGVSSYDVSVIQGEERTDGAYLDSRSIASAAILYFCPDMNGS